VKIDSRLRWQFRLQSGLFVALFLAFMGLLAWLSQLNPLSIDLTVNQRNSLSEESIRLVKSLQHPLQITIFISPVNENRDVLETLFERYQEHQPLLEFRSLNPDLSPDLLRQHDIRFDGETLIEYQGRNEKISQVSESLVTNAIQRLVRQGERWLVFLQGHGERNPYSERNHDFSEFAASLASKGFTIENLALTQTNSIPQNTDVLVIASPRIALLPGEIELIDEYLEQGGNLLWLADTEQTTESMELISDRLTVDFLPGVIVDPNAQLLGLNRIDFALVGEYPRHPITQGIDSLSLFPQAQALEFNGEGELWRQSNFLVSSNASWNETGNIEAEPYNGDNDDETQGPLKIGMTLSANHEKDDGSKFEQRVAIIGDADFLSNRYLGNGSNLELGLNLANWLSHDDNLIAISPRAAPDTRLELSQTQQVIIGVGFLLVLPLSLFGAGLTIWLKRRNR
jgi:ABC-type uncharacterized transport system involved in gliding motility auxiliary subunit